MSVKVLVSLTSIPRRLDTSLIEVLDSLAGLGHAIVVSIPDEYRKWGRATVPEVLGRYDNVIVWRPQKDYGPATKLLGALEYLERHPGFDYIVTLDDDRYYSDPRGFIEYLLEHARRRPGCVITIGGIKLVRYPYFSKNGLSYKNLGYVDAVADFRGVLYPTAIFERDRRIFTLMDKLLPGVFHEDDAYIGVAMSAMGVPIYAVRTYEGRAGETVSLLRTSEGKRSAVQEQAEKDRRVNEMEIYQQAVREGYLPNRAGRRRSLAGRISLALRTLAGRGTRR